MACLVAVVLAVATSAGPSGAEPRAASPTLGVPSWAGGVVVALVASSAVVLTYALAQRRPRLDVGTTSSGEEGSRPWWAYLVATAAAAAVLAALLGALALLARGKKHTSKTQFAGGAGPAGLVAGHHAAAAGTPWVPALVGVGVAVAGIVVWRARHSARPERRGVVSLSPAGGGSRQAAAVRAVDDWLEALEAEPDPRKAVIAAYGRMDQWMAAAGLGRMDWEAPFEHLDRVLAELGRPAPPGPSRDGATGPVRAAEEGQPGRAGVGLELAGLFERARYDRRPCGPQMKSEALGALARLRADLLRPAG